MKSKNLIIKVAFLAVALSAMPVIAAAQATFGTHVYLNSRLLNFTKGQAVGIHFCNTDRVVRDVKLYIVDANGNTLKMAVARVAPGQAVSLNFTYGELPRGSSPRFGVRGVAIVVDPPDPDADPPSERLSLASMEVYDVLTGKTSWGLPLIVGDPTASWFPTDQ